MGGPQGPVGKRLRTSSRRVRIRDDESPEATEQTSQISLERACQSSPLSFESSQKLRTPRSDRPCWPEFLAPPARTSSRSPKEKWARARFAANATPPSSRAKPTSCPRAPGTRRQGPPRLSTRPCSATRGRRSSITARAARRRWKPLPSKPASRNPVRPADSGCRCRPRRRRRPRPHSPLF